MSPTLVSSGASIDGTIRSMYLSFGAAYDIAKYVSIGASANVIFSQVETVRARTAAGNNSVVDETIYAPRKNCWIRLLCCFRFQLIRIQADRPNDHTL